MSERPRALHVIPEHFSGNEDVKKFLRQYSMITEFNNWSEKDKINCLPMFVKDTASIFLDNLYDTKNNWTWKEIEEEFIEQDLPIGHITFLRTTLENKRQGESETATNFMTEIESLCRQIDNKMKKEEDNTTLKKLKENLNKFELMQHGISNRGATTSEYGYYHDEKEREEKKLQVENEEYKRRIDQISEEVRRLNIIGKQSNKMVELLMVDTTKNDIEHTTQIERKGGEIMIEIEIMSEEKNISTKVRTQEGHVNKVRTQEVTIGVELTQGNIREIIETDRIQERGHTNKTIVIIKIKTVETDAVVETDKQGKEHRRDIGMRTGKEK
ncbi:hypothetical protein ACI65C_013405 [Semiaphis heraclei]